MEPKLKRRKGSVKQKSFPNHANQEDFSEKILEPVKKKSEKVKKRRKELKDQEVAQVSSCSVQEQQNKFFNEAEIEKKNRPRENGPQKVENFATQKSNSLKTSRQILLHTEASETQNFTTKKGRLSKVPILEVTRHNINTLWPYILMSIKNSDFLSLDLEFSGLGARKQLFAKSVEDRYLGGKEAAESRGVLAFGLATFKLKNRQKVTTEGEGVKGQRKRLKICAKVFNFLTAPQDDFVCENGSLTYLAEGNFDLGKVFMDGIFYRKGEDQKKIVSPIRSLITEIFTAGKPLVVHNGLLDLVFLYGNFYTNLPEKSGEFLADLAEIVGEVGLFDSKYLAEFQLKLPASFLEFLFRFCQRNNDQECRSERLYIGLEFEFPPCGSWHEFLKIVECPLPRKDHNPATKVDQESLCLSQSHHGYCNKGSTCKKSHDLDAFLDCLEAKQEKKRQKRKRRYSESSSSTANDVNCERVPCQLKTGIAGTNRAGFDAFMAGFSMAFGSRVTLWKSGCLPKIAKNNLYLSGKDFPLKIQASEFVGKSPGHVNKWEKICGV